MSSELDLSQYCFITNRLLLSGDLIPPSKDMAEKLWFFHELSNSEKEQILPIIEEVFRQPEFTYDENIENIGESLQTWLQQLIQLDSQKKRKMAIWLSRYCYDPQTIISTLTKILQPPEVNDQHEQLSQSPRPTNEPPSAKTTSPTLTKTDESKNSSSASPKTQAKAPSTRKKAPDLTIPISLIMGIFIIAGTIFHFAVNKADNNESINNQGEITPENTNPKTPEATPSPEPIQTPVLVTTPTETPGKLLSLYTTGKFLLGNRLGQQPELAEPIAKCLAKHLPLFEIYQAKGSIQVGDEVSASFRGRFVDINKYFKDTEEKTYEFTGSGNFQLISSQASDNSTKTKSTLTSCNKVKFDPDYHTVYFLQQIDFYKRFNSNQTDTSKFQVK